MSKNPFGKVPAMTKEKGKKGMSHAFAKGGRVDGGAINRELRSRESGMMDQTVASGRAYGDYKPPALYTRGEAKNAVAAREAERGPEDVFKHGNRDYVTRGLLDRDNRDRERSGGMAKGDDKDGDSPNAYKHGGKVRGKPC